MTHSQVHDARGVALTPHAGEAVEDGADERGAGDTPSRRSRRWFSLDDMGQATTEYALVLLAAALVGLLVVAWATAGGGAAAIAGLFNRVISSVAGKV